MLLEAAGNIYNSRNFESVFDDEVYTKSGNLQQ